MSKKTKTKRIRDYFYRAGAVICAVLLWFFVVQTQNPISERLFSLPLDIRNLDSSLSVLAEDYQIHIRVQGQKQLVDNLMPRDFEAYVNCDNLGAGEITLQVRISLPEGVQEISRRPETVQLTLEEMANRLFDLEVDLNALSIPFGYQLLEPVLAPAQVVISGPSSRLDSIDRVFVAIPTLELDQNYRQKLPLQVVDKNDQHITNWLSLSPDTAELFLPVIQELPGKLVPINPNLLGEVAPDYQISQTIIEPATVKIIGALPNLSEINFLTTRPIDVANAKKDISRRVELSLPDNISLAAPENYVNVVIRIEPTEKLQFDGLSVYVKEAGEDLIAETIGSNTFEVEVAVPRSQAALFDREDILLYIDVSGLPPGRYTLPLQADLSGLATLIEINPQEALVEITAKENPTQPAQDPQKTNGNNQPTTPTIE